MINAKLNIIFFKYNPQEEEPVQKVRPAMTNNYIIRISPLFLTMLLILIFTDIYIIFQALMCFRYNDAALIISGAQAFSVILIAIIFFMTGSTGLIRIIFLK